MYFLYGVGEQASFSDIFSLVIVWITVFLIVFNLIQADGGIGMDISQPMPLYGLFFIMYYLAPYLVLFYTGAFPEGMEIIIASLFLLAYFGMVVWYKGYY